MLFSGSVQTYEYM